MKKLSLVALIAAGIFALYTAPSFAMAATVPPKPKDPPCTVDCNPGGDPTTPGDPFDPKNPNGDPTDPGDGPGDPGDGPGDPGDGPGDPGDGPGNPGDGPGNPGDGPGDAAGLTKAELAELNACLVRLEGLPQISAGEINGFSDPSKVSLVPVCEVKGLTEAETAIVEKGNAAGLEGVIKSNELMRSKLGMTAYKARDVVGIDFDEKGNATLFVHKRG